MKNFKRFAALGLALLLTAFAAQSASADWQDGYWYLDFASRSQQISNETSSAEFIDLYILLERHAADVESAAVVFLDSDLGVVLLDIGQQVQVYEVTADEALLLLEIFDDMSLEQTAVQIGRETSSLMLMVTPRIIIE